MNKWIWIVLAIIALIFLGIRGFMVRINDVNEERRWYLGQLNFEFSGIVDSVIRPGKILFHVTRGQLDREKEKKLRTQLKRNGNLDLLLYRPNNQQELIIARNPECMKGDSLYLDSNKSVVRIYRNMKLISERELLKSLRGRPF